jgi:DNA modification methylase
MTAIVLRGDAAHLPLPDGSVDLIVTSPPYWQQRDYQDGGKSIPGQTGGEDHPDGWLKAMQDTTREWCRVLKPAGSIFVNLDDKYATRYSSLRKCGRKGTNNDDDTRSRSGPNRTGTADKSLLGLPWRYAIGCMDDLGLILRKDIVWSKTNGLPDKAKDRVGSSHEYLFHFVRQRFYHSDTDAIREPYAAWTAKAYEYEQHGYQRRDNSARMDRGGFAKPPKINPLGKMPGSVWEITPQPLDLPGFLGVDHFAPMPMEMARRCILGWSPPRGIVLDPFGGVGTTALVAAAFGRTGVSIDLSHDYSRAARWRVTDPVERARAMHVPKPPPVPEGQGSLFDEAGL